MKRSNHRIKYLLRLIAFFSVVFTLLIQPMIQSFACFEEQDFELVDIDTEKDSNEKENQEEDSKDKKIELQCLSSYYDANLFIKKSSLFGEQYLKWDFTLETHIPPPERA